MVYDAYQVELKREKLSIGRSGTNRAHKFADGKTMADDKTQLGQHIWRHTVIFGADTPRQFGSTPTLHTYKLVPSRWLSVVIRLSDSRRQRFKNSGDNMEIITKKVKDLKPYERNPRRNDEAVKYVAESISEFGFKVPIVIDGDGTIICQGRA